MDTNVEKNINNEQYGGQQVFYFSPDELHDHPRNNEFFDDMEGSKWNGFLESVSRTGIKVPLVVTQDMVIVSGHQRKRAACHLGVKVPCIVNEYHDRCGIAKDDWILYDLISTNTDQRGFIGGSELKAVKRVEAIRNIFGIGRGKHNQCDNVSTEDGANNYNCDNESVPHTAQEASEKAGLNYSSYRQLKHLLTVIPEIQEAVELGQVSPSVAARIIGRLPEEDQYYILKNNPNFEGWTKQFLEEEVEKMKLENQKLSESFNQERASYVRKLEKQTQRAEKAESDINVLKRLGDPGLSKEIDNLKLRLQNEHSKAETLKEELERTQKRMLAVQSASDKNLGYSQGLEELVEQLKQENERLLSAAEPIDYGFETAYNVTKLINDVEKFKIMLNTNMLEEHHFVPVDSALEFKKVLEQLCNDISKYCTVKSNCTYVAS